jgi:membrane protease subunit HflK
MFFEQPEVDAIRRSLQKNLKVVMFIFFMIFNVVGIMSSFYTVEPEEEAVVLRLGAYHETNSPGLHFKWPFGIDEVIKIQSKRIHQEEFGFRSSGQSGGRTQYSEKNFELESLMLTGDLNVAEVEWVVQYQIGDPYKFLFKIRSPKITLRDISESIMRRVVGDHSVTEVLTTGRVEIATKAQLWMQEILDRYDVGMRIVSVKLQDVNPPRSVRPSFNEVNAAKQEQEKMINEAEQAYNKVIPKARGEAMQTISKAEGQAMEIINEAKGDTQRFTKFLEAYEKSPSISKKRLYLQFMEKIIANNPQIILVDPKVKGLVPIFDSLPQASAK